MARLRSLPVVLTGAAFALAACGSSATSSAPAGKVAPSSSTLRTDSSSLGSIVVDGSGMTVYVYDKDTRGTATSACTGACLSAWPPVEVSGKPKVSGVTGTVATITAPDGGQQVTLNGWPLYTYIGDGAPGDVNGQASQGVWWAVAPSGDKITSAGASTGAGGSGGGGAGYGGGGW